MEHQKFTQASEALLFSSEFRELREALEFPEPNLWHILGISRREVRISRFLAWLLEPRSGHAFGEEFLKNFIIHALQTEAGKQSDLTPVDVYMMRLSDVEVETEYRLGNRRCDILAFTPDETATLDEGFLCIIENKIDAKEGDNQTKDYEEKSRVLFPPASYPHRVYIYLSPDGALPQNENFIPLSYQDVLQVIDGLIAGRRTTDTERFLLQQFQENILRGIAMDTKTLDLAQAIYDQHQEVIEFIIQNVDRESEDGDETSLGEKEWDGKSRFFNIGEMPGSGYRWEDCRKYSFICAGGGKRYRDSIVQLKVGDIIYAYVSKKGYVGIGTVSKKAVPLRRAKLGDGQRLSDVELVGEYDDSEDDEFCDWVVLVKWESNVDKDRAVRQPPIARTTTSRIYEHRRDIIRQVKSELARIIRTPQ